MPTVSESVVEVCTKPRFMQAMKYSDYEDVYTIAKWIGDVVSIDINMRPGFQGEAVIEYNIPGPIGTTNKMILKLGYWVVEDGGRKFSVYDDNQFRARYDVEADRNTNPTYDGRILTYGGNRVVMDQNDAMDLALVIGQYVADRRSEEYERLRAEGQFWRVNICRYRVANPNVYTDDAVKTMDIEIEYSLEGAFMVFVTEILREQTASWQNAKIECPDGSVIQGGELMDMVQVYDQSYTRTQQ